MTKVEWPKVASYVIGQQEIGESGYIHWQIYIEFSRTVELKYLKKNLPWPDAHCEVRRGTQNEAIAYVTKKDTQVEGTQFSYGDLKRQGERKDLHAVAAEVAKGGDLKELEAENPGLFTQYGRGLRELAMNQMPEPTVGPIEVWWLWGPPGTGKTRTVYNMFEVKDICRASYTNGSWWFPRYVAQKCILLDDYNEHTLGNYILELCDKYPVELNYKGGSAIRRCTHIIITSNVEPQAIHGIPAAFWRRLTRLEHMTVEYKDI